MCVWVFLFFCLCSFFVCEYVFVMALFSFFLPFFFFFCRKRAPRHAAGPREVYTMKSRVLTFQDAQLFTPRRPRIWLYRRWWCLAVSGMV